MLTDHETQTDLTAANAAARPAALTQEVNLDHLYEAVVELAP
jgi:hypothetical protein